MELTQVLISIICVQVLKCSGLDYPETDRRTYTACRDEFPTASCDGSDVILVNDVLGGSKPTSSACPVDPFSGVNPECCVEEPQDCLYPTTSDPSYDEEPLFAGCSGVGSCNTQQAIGIVSVDQTICNITEYKIFSQYIQLGYYCVEETRIGQVCTSQKIQTFNAPIYTQSPDYPGTVIVGDNVCDCSIQTQDTSKTITVYYIHGNLYEENGACQQSLVFEDGDSNITNTCDNNNNYATYSVQSSTSYIRLIWTNTAASTGGQFWVGFYAQDTNLTVNCPAIAQTTTPTQPITTPTPTDPTTHTISPTSVTDKQNQSTEALNTTITSNTTVENSNTTTIAPDVSPNLPSSGSSESTDYNLPIALIAVASLIGFLLIVLIIIVCVLCFRLRHLDRHRVTDIEHGKDVTPVAVSEPKIIPEPESSPAPRRKPEHKRKRRMKKGTAKPTLNGNSDKDLAKLGSAKPVKPLKGNKEEKRSIKSVESAKYKKSPRPKPLNGNAVKDLSKRDSVKANKPLKDNKDDKTSLKSSESTKYKKSPRPASAASKIASPKTIQRSRTWPYKGIPKRPSSVTSRSNSVKRKPVKSRSKLDAKPSNANQTNEAQGEVQSLISKQSDKEIEGLKVDAPEKISLGVISSNLSKTESVIKETKGNRKRSKTPSKRSRLTLKQSQYYETRLKIVTGSNFRYSSFFKEYDIKPKKADFDNKANLPRETVAVSTQTEPIDDQARATDKRE